MTLLGYKTILHKKCRSGKNSEGPAENSWVLDLCPAKWKQISKSLDENALSYEGHNLDQLITVLERDSLTLIDWFTENQMKANPDKFQAIAIGKKTKNENISFNLNGNIIKCEDEVKLLGVTIDFELNFNTHIANICKKTSRQLNILKRIGKYLTKLGRLTKYTTLLFSQTLIIAL